MGDSFQEDIILHSIARMGAGLPPLSQMQSTPAAEAEFVICDYTIPKWIR
jgi:hypothetical protein